MKNLLTVIALTLLCFQGYSQRNPDMKIGIGMPFFLGNKSGETEISKLNAFPTVSLEKPIPIHVQGDEKISFTPGASFFVFREKEELGSEVAGKNNKLTHFSFNAYTKLVYNLMIQRRSEAFVYFGGVAGFHITTRTIGTEYIYSAGAGYDEENNIKRSGRDFYNNLYYGAVLGFQPNLKVTNKYVPSFELSFYPNFVTRLNEEKANAIQFTVLLGINN